MSDQRAKQAAALAAFRAGEVARAERDAAAFRALMQGGSAPEACGDAIPVAPARPGLRLFVPRRVIINADGQSSREIDDGYRGRSGARVGDAFDEMTDQAERAHHRKGKDAGPFVPPFTNGQVSIGRDYATLTERCEASGVKCSSLEALRNQGNSGGDREEAMLADFQRLRALHRRIGDGLAKQARKQKPSATSAPGKKHISIRTRVLVDAVCIYGKALDHVLDDFGWGKNGKTRKALRDDLCAALDRMQGYRER